MVKRVFSIRPFESKTNPKWLFVDDNFCYTTKPRTYKEFMDVVKANVNNLNLENDEHFHKCYDYYVECLKDFKYLNTTNSKWFKITHFLIPSENNASLVSKNYYICRGYSEEYAIKTISEYQNITSEASYIKRYGEEEGKKKYQEHIGLVSKKSKEYFATHEHQLSYSKTINPSTGEYYTKEECLEKMKENFRKGSDKMSQLFKEGKVFTIWQPEYWLRQGYSEKEAKDIIYSKMAHNSIEYFVGKYGEKEGLERYNARMKKFLETWNSKSDDELADIYKRRTKVPHKTSKASKTFFENCMETLYKEYNITLGKVFYDDNEYYLYDKENKSLYFYDFCDMENKIIVEYNGYKFHPYKNVQGDDLKNWRSLFFGIEGEYQRKRDFDKQKLAESMGFKYLVVWDIEDPQLSLNNFLKLYISNKQI